MFSFGIVVCSGNVTWGAVREGGVQAYIDAVRPDRAKAIAGGHRAIHIEYR